ncbi:MAG: hypothetical protein IPI42_10745 [Saprospiraceae bacterium]|nr:hypothetical protein [Candidatus Parvibacillus calidus]
MADCKTLEHVIDELRVSTSGQTSGSTVVVMQASPRKRIFRLLEQRRAK